ncbi:hypothetical protein K490DRAFT_57504 [Saccharata proteae CBS 121410]|uniref:Uncharacterized protein n=1 Tax=Saccharata proteae CBS 121410 TaxID=1314787 RepID=A0A9P4HV32_9PEZI|nr:hypothetical protein K490DRAFT_57504 [Saccharata proteae CBS 121410]
MNRLTFQHIGESSEPIEEGWEVIDIRESVDSSYGPLQYVPPGPIEDLYQTVRVNTNEVWGAARNAYEAHLREHVDLTLEDLHEAAKSAAILAAAVAIASTTVTIGVAVEGFEALRDVLLERFQRSDLGSNLCLRIDEYRKQRLRQIKTVRDRIFKGQRRYRLKDQLLADRESIAVVSERVDELPHGGSMIDSVNEPLPYGPPNTRLPETDDSAPRADSSQSNHSSLDLVHTKTTRTSIDGWDDGWNKTKRDLEAGSNSKLSGDHNGECARTFVTEADLRDLDSMAPELSKSPAEIERSHNPAAETTFDRAFNLNAAPSGSFTFTMPQITDKSMSSTTAQTVEIAPMNRGFEGTISKDKYYESNTGETLPFDSSAPT